MQNGSGYAALVVAAVLIGSGAQATDAPHECTTSGNGNWTIITEGRFDSLCPSGGASECTGIEYDIVQNTNMSADHVALLVEHQVVVLEPGSQNINAPGEGDAPTDLGLHDFSTQAIRVNENPETNAFSVIVEGNLQETTGSIVVKKGRTIEACRIATLGEERSAFDENAQRTAAEMIDFKGCMVTIPTDTQTGEGGVATISGEGCVFVANAEAVDEAELVVSGIPVGNLTFGSGSVSSGTDSCTTRIIRRRIYTWCTCVGDDPTPPCP